MKCQSLFSGSDKKNIINLLPAELAQSVFKVKSFFIQSTLVISNFTGPDKNVRVISSSRQPNCDVIGMTTLFAKTCLEGTCIWQFKYFTCTSVCIVTVCFRRCNGFLEIISSINVNNNKLQTSLVVF